VVWSKGFTPVRAREHPDPPRSERRPLRPLRPSACLPAARRGPMTGSERPELRAGPAVVGRASVRRFPHTRAASVLLPNATARRLCEAAVRTWGPQGVARPGGTSQVLVWTQGPLGTPLGGCVVRWGSPVAGQATVTEFGWDVGRGGDRGGVGRARLHRRVGRGDRRVARAPRRRGCRGAGGRRPPACALPVGHGPGRVSRPPGWSSAPASKPRTRSSSRPRA
jgi:hypothetical protein